MKGGIKVKLEPDQDIAARPILGVEGGMSETDPSLNDHIMKGLLTQKGVFEIKQKIAWNG